MCAWGSDAAERAGSYLALQVCNSTCTVFIWNFTRAWPVTIVPFRGSDEAHICYFVRRNQRELERDESPAQIRESKGTSS